MSSVGTALASMSSVPSTIVDRLVRPSCCLFELFNPVEDLVLELVLVLDLELVLELELVLVLDLVLDLLKSFSTSGWFSYPGYYTDIEMPLFAVQWKSNKIFLQHKIYQNQLTFCQVCKTGKADNHHKLQLYGLLLKSNCIFLFFLVRKKCCLRQMLHRRL